MIDIHTHLYFPQYDTDRDEVITKAFANGMTRMVSVGTEPLDWEQALSMTEKDARIKAAIGIHPHWYNELAAANKERSHPSVTEYRDSSPQAEEQENAKGAIQKLRECIRENREKIVALGECGLDYFSRTDEQITKEQKTVQREGFLAQIQVAREFGLPLIIHTRPSVGSMDAYEDVLEILTQELSLRAKRGNLPQNNTKYILHCYMGDTEVTKKFLELSSVYFSFTGNITYPSKKNLQGTKDDLVETVKLIPLERILTETDCPFLAPQGHRGQRNEPSFVAEVVAKIAEIKNVSIDQVNESVEQNAAGVLG